jgi:Flp pilus assembly protein TadG
MTHHGSPVARTFGRLGQTARSFWYDDAGSPAVEFALIAPVLLLIVAATFDVGSIIHSKFRLDARVSSAASYSQNLGSMIVDNTAASFAATLATLVSNGTNTVDATVVLNNAMSAAFTDGTMTTSDSSGIMAQCYCPVRVNNAISWGTQKTCQATCTDGTVAGRFIEIRGDTPYVAMFAGLGLTENGIISANALVRIE